MVAFYENILGLRLVKQTVNFDDPYTYHLYYGDAVGSPGTILTFFPWTDLPQGTPGAGMITAVAFAVPEAAIVFWRGRIGEAGIGVERDTRFGEPVLRFADPHGLPIELIGTSAPAPTRHWTDGPVPPRDAIAGFHSATVTLNAVDDKRSFLADVMGLTLEAREGNRYRFRTADPEAPGSTYDVMVDADAAPGRPGTGTVHHIAFRTGSNAAQTAWQEVLRQSGTGVTGVRDRNYFRSIYFHSPGGVLFEIATDPPGFTVDEPVDALGTSLKLPALYEPMRTDIADHLPPLRSGDAPLKREDRGVACVEEEC
jgi:glyoxalase family protein